LTFSTRGKYGEGESEERFTYSVSLVFVQCVVNYFYAVITSKYVLKQTGEDTTKTSYYAVCSFAYLTAMVTSNKALMWVNYPTQVVGKSCKPIPVLLLGVLIGRKRYPALKYLFILLIVIGVAMFMYKDGATAAVKEDSAGYLGFGEILLLVSLTCDGLTGAVQERMKSEHQTKSGHMMRAMNKWSIFYLAVALAGTGEIWEFVAFVGRFPDVIWQLALFSITSALGQYFIFMCVSEFGPLPCSIVTTTRKFFTVLASVVFFGNSLAQRQWIGATFVFMGKTRKYLELPSKFMFYFYFQACSLMGCTGRRRRRSSRIDN
jgi:UDP-galactose transporter B1